MKILNYLFIAFILFGCESSDEFVEESAYSEILEYGSYAVGFRTMFAMDLSRENIPYSDWSGRLYPSDELLPGRSLPINVWYPAATSGGSLDYEYFVNLIIRQSAQSESDSSDSLAKQIFIYQTNELGGDGNFKESDLNTLLKHKTRSFLNAKPVEGKFPLIIFPNGTSPSNQNIMCEYLASYGYVVASLALKGQFSHVIDASVKGLEVAVDDLEFALQRLIPLKNVDDTKIALLANAIESSFCAGLISRNKKIKALVSLDGGFLSQFEQDILNKTNFYEPQNITIPILSIYAPHPAISPHYIQDLKYSNRYFAHFPEMSEFHFLNYGIFEGFVPGIIGDTKGNTTEGFKAASELTLIFLDAILKDKIDALEWVYSGRKSHFEKSTIDTLFRISGITAPPNITIMKDLFVTKGMSAIDSIYKAHRAQNNLQPFSKKFYKNFKNWLAWKKDPDFTNRKQLFELAVDSYPKSAVNNYYLAYYLTKTGNKELSQAYYSKSLKLLETDDEIDPERKNELKESILSSLD